MLLLVDAFAMVEPIVVVVVWDKVTGFVTSRMPREMVRVGTLSAELPKLSTKVTGKRGICGLWEVPFLGPTYNLTQRGRIEKH
jgi:hypothetical protein